MSPRASERRAIAGPVEDVPDARPPGTAVSTTAPLGIARVRRGRAEEGAVEHLMAAPSELPQHLAVERPSGPHGHPSLTLLRAIYQHPKRSGHLLPSSAIWPMSRSTDCDHSEHAPKASPMTGGSDAR